MATSRKLRRTPRTKTPKTIRTQLKSPTARRLAKISRAMLVLQKRINVLVDDFEADYRTLLATEKQLKEKKMPQQMALDAAQTVSEALGAITDADYPAEEDLG